ncbi:MAG: UDP-N-acetylmuramyl-tripeptide synthetase [bacterium]|nr:UDP-N-acetylmuramyl-tripeptide synthetase [bacterium]
MEQLLYIIKKFVPRGAFKYLRPVYHFTLSWLAAFWYRFPSEKLIVIGVTGTTGKSTVVHLIAKMLEEAGYRVGYTSTAVFKIADKEWMNDRKMTMVGRFFTQRMLANMQKAGCQYAIIETTSEGIEQFRHRFINYDMALITGLYPEHIEAHGSFTNYRNAKGKLFAHLSTCPYKYVDADKKAHVIKNEIKKLDLDRVKKIIIANGDDEHAQYFLNFKADEKIKYEVRSQKREGVKATESNSDIATVVASKVEANSGGIYFTINGITFHLRLMGEFNIGNALAAVSVGLAQGLPLEIIKEGLEKISGVPGRFERIDEKQNFSVIVDYAFEPNAVAKLYETIKTLNYQKVIHVLGSAGGGRDLARRPRLGMLAGENADIVIITNEDPYDDDPQIIIDQVGLGAEKAGKELNRNLFKILDRREAIRKALAFANANDVVLITGKGCEQAMCVAGGKKIPWDDREAVREELLRMKNSS